MMNECDQETEQRSGYGDMQVERWRECKLGCASFTIKMAYVVLYITFAIYWSYNQQRYEIYGGLRNGFLFSFSINLLVWFVQ